MNSDPLPVELPFAELVRNAEYCNLTKLIRKAITNNVLLFKMTKVTHALHGYLIPDAHFVKYLIIDQEYSAPGGSYFGLRFIYRISP